MLPSLTALNWGKPCASGLPSSDQIPHYQPAVGPETFHAVAPHGETWRARGPRMPLVSDAPSRVDIPDLVHTAHKVDGTPTCRSTFGPAGCRSECYRVHVHLQESMGRRTRRPVMRGSQGAAVKGRRRRGGLGRNRGRVRLLSEPTKDASHLDASLDLKTKWANSGPRLPEPYSSTSHLLVHSCLTPWLPPPNLWLLQTFTIPVTAPTSAFVNSCQSKPTPSRKADRRRVRVRQASGETDRAGAAGRLGGTAVFFRNVVLFPDQEFSFELNQTWGFYGELPAGPSTSAAGLCVRLPSLGPFIVLLYWFRNKSGWFIQ